MSDSAPYIAPQASVAELTCRSIILAIILTVLLAMSNAYLALKLGILTSASIPAAIISMGILRFFKHSTILENNAVQTAASAGEAIAGGIVYTIPALIIIQYWHHFDYLTNFIIAAMGGTLGVLFSIPLRRILVNERSLKFPEGRAIAEVLKSSAGKTGIQDIFFGGAIGALLELFQVGFKLIASNWTVWFFAKRTLLGFGAGFSATMIGAGYLIGHEMAISIFLGAIIAWLLALPLSTHFFPTLTQFPAERAMEMVWSSHLRYLGIGAMLFAGCWTFLRLVKPLILSVTASFQAFMAKTRFPDQVPRTERDIPMPYIVSGVILMAAILFLFFQFIFPLNEINLDTIFAPTLIFIAVLYVIIIGFLFSVITGYFSGMVGVSASPGSSVVIAGMLFAAWILSTLIHKDLSNPLNAEQLKAAEAIAIIIGSVVTGIAAIANDNMQDLKVGQLVGATPWKQQLMLLLGVLVSALVIPPVMQMLFNVYGIAGVMPHPGMDVSQSLPAPTAALMAAITQAVFSNTLPWNMFFIGAVIILLLLVVIRISNLNKHIRLSILGIAIGMYLPLTSSVPLFLGGLISWFVRARLEGSPEFNQEEIARRNQIGILIACGLVAGSALVDVFLAVPFSIMHSPDALQLVGNAWKPYSVLLAIMTTCLLFFWMNWRICKKN